MAFPTIQGRDTQVSPTADATSWTIPFPAGWDDNLAGDRLLVFVSSDGVPTLSTPTAGWSVLTQVISGGSAVKGAIFSYTVPVDDTAIPDLQVDSTSAEQFSSAALWLRSSTGAFGVITANAIGLSANPDAPAATNSSGASIDALAIASRHTDLTDASSVQPTGYANVQQRLGGGANGVTTETAEKQITLANGAAENPSAWTIANSRRWVAFTALLYETAGGGGGRPKVNVAAAWVEKPAKVWNGSAWVEKPMKRHDGAAWV